MVAAHIDQGEISVDSQSKKPIARIILIAVCVLIFAGLIAYSLLRVRYPVNGEAQDELLVTELSLTHSIERGEDGKFVTPDPSERGVSAGGEKACPT